MNNKYYITSENNGHTHLWKEDKKFTSFDAGHNHPLNLKKMIAIKGKSNHIHKLLKKEDKI